MTQSTTTLVDAKYDFRCPALPWVVLRYWKQAFGTDLWRPTPIGCGSYLSDSHSVSKLVSTLTTYNHKLSVYWCIYWQTMMRNTLKQPYLRFQFGPQFIIQMVLTTTLWIFTLLRLRFISITYSIEVESIFIKAKYHSLAKWSRNIRNHRSDAMKLGTRFKDFSSLWKRTVRLLSCLVVKKFCTLKHYVVVGARPRSVKVQTQSNSKVKNVKVSKIWWTHLTTLLQDSRSIVSLSLNTVIRAFYSQHNS